MFSGRDTGIFAHAVGVAIRPALLGECARTLAVVLGLAVSLVEAFTRAFEQEVRFRGVSAGTVHPAWIGTDLVREAELDLPSFREMRAKLPWPLRKTTSVEACAREIVDGIEARSRRTVVPRSAGLLYWFRSVVTSGPGAKAVGREAAKIVPQMEREIEQLGRPASARTMAINEID